ncbi:hypothetical protein [Helicobacter felistomachi]|uniref:hypothetical protein n=1 Tax=Helicobacter felistomachi TaxID=3040201 RepID=UPI002574507F|nr:hypothetical protein [Helicobacter sp. NHP21005]
MPNSIKIHGAKENNLKNIDLEIPKNQFIVFTGLSGSGKSTLAFDTLYAEGQRRYLESLSSYARQFLDKVGKPAVDKIEGLIPAIAIDQKTTSKNPAPRWAPLQRFTIIYAYSLRESGGNTATCVARRSRPCKLATSSPKSCKSVRGARF